MLGNAMTLPVLARVMRMVLGAAGFTDTADVLDKIEAPYKTLSSNSLYVHRSYIFIHRSHFASRWKSPLSWKSLGFCVKFDWKKKENSGVNMETRACTVHTLE